MEDQPIEVLTKRLLIQVILPRQAPKLAEEVLMRCLLPDTGSLGTLLSAPELFLLVQESFYPRKEKECWHMLIDLIGRNISAREFDGPLSKQDIEMVKKDISQAVTVCSAMDPGPPSIDEFIEAIDNHHHHLPVQEQSTVVPSLSAEYTNNVTNPIGSDFMDPTPAEPPQAVSVLPAGSSNSSQIHPPTH
ncbi:hypothetical protein FRC17_004857 [Serendipita sp. 399]|nr:hypothetical protein FRC17_004857 [Serendipita sp. 399]